mmetsp:Transcript_12457/g.35002  ORF Transcript_12457/g.35002 Transcript_12457/m.35002 type:complete len:568 (-) Transcript_12457:204-1907(-)
MFSVPFRSLSTSLSSSFSSTRMLSLISSRLWRITSSTCLKRMRPPCLLSSSASQPSEAFSSSRASDLNISPYSNRMERKPSRSTAPPMSQSAASSGLTAPSAASTNPSSRDEYRTSPVVTLNTFLNVSYNDSSSPSWAFTSSLLRPHSLTMASCAAFTTRWHCSCISIMSVSKPSKAIPSDPESVAALTALLKTLHSCARPSLVMLCRHKLSKMLSTSARSRMPERSTSKSWKVCSRPGRRMTWISSRTRGTASQQNVKKSTSPSRAISVHRWSTAFLSRFVSPPRPNSLMAMRRVLWSRSRAPSASCGVQEDSTAAALNAFCRAALCSSGRWSNARWRRRVARSLRWPSRCSFVRFFNDVILCLWWLANFSLPSQPFRNSLRSRAVGTEPASSSSMPSALVLLLGMTAKSFVSGLKKGAEARLLLLAESWELRTELGFVGRSRSGSCAPPPVLGEGGLGLPSRAAASEPRTSSSRRPLRSATSCCTTWTVCFREVLRFCGRALRADLASALARRSCLWVLASRACRRAATPASRVTSRRCRAMQQSASRIPSRTFLSPRKIMLLQS